MNIKKIKYLIGASVVCYGYLYGFKNKNNIDLSNKYNLLVSLKLNAEQAVLLSNQISKYTSKNLNCKIQNTDSLLSTLNDKTNNIELDLTLHKDIDHKDHFAKVKSNWIKINPEKWIPTSMDIKFNNYSNWILLYRELQVEDKDQNFDYRFDNIKSSKLIQNSDSFLNNVSKEPHILKAIEILLKNQQIIESLGPPICFSFLYFNSFSEDFKFARVRIDGQLKSSDFLISTEKTQFEGLIIVYDLDERLFSKRPLIIKNFDDRFESIKKRKDSVTWLNILKQIEINKIIENKIEKNNHTLSTLGDPIEYKFEVDENNDITEKNVGVLKVFALGRLNNAVLIVNLIKDETNEK